MQLDSTECIHTLTGDQAGSLQLSPDMVTTVSLWSSDHNDAHFRFSSGDVDDSAFPVASAHDLNDVSCGSEPGEVKSRDFDENEQSLQVTTCSVTEDSSTTQTYCTTDAAEAVTSSSSSSSFLSLLSAKLHRPQVMRSLGHVLADVMTWRVIRRQRVPAATGDQSAAGDVARLDDVDLTSLLPTL